jgi:hypothetical protein
MRSAPSGSCGLRAMTARPTCRCVGVTRIVCRSSGRGSLSASLPKIDAKSANLQTITTTIIKFINKLSRKASSLHSRAAAVSCAAHAAAKDQVEKVLWPPGARQLVPSQQITPAEHVSQVKVGAAAAKDTLHADLLLQGHGERDHTRNCLIKRHTSGRRGRRERREGNEK